MGALRMEHLSLKRLSGEGLDGCPLQGNMEDMLRRLRIRASFTIGEPGTWNGTHIPGTMKDE